MTYAFTQDVPIDAAFYQRITDGLGSVAPEGLIAHLAVEVVAPALHPIDGAEGACVVSARGNGADPAARAGAGR